MSYALNIPPALTLDEFLAWDAPPGPAWQLIDGEPVQMAPTSRTHGAIQAELGALIRNHLERIGGPCSLISAPGIVPRLMSKANYRIPDLGVTCTPYRDEEYGVAEPVLVIEILSPGNRSATWRNVWTYASIPSVREILVVHSTEILAELLRRDADGTWPDRAARIEDGVLELASIGFQTPLAALYRTTRLAP